MDLELLPAARLVSCPRTRSELNELASCGGDRSTRIDARAVMKEPNMMILIDDPIGVAVAIAIFLLMIR